MGYIETMKYHLWFKWLGKVACLRCQVKKTKNNESGECKHEYSEKILLPNIEPKKGDIPEVETSRGTRNNRLSKRLRKVQISSPKSKRKKSSGRTSKRSRKVCK